MPSPRWIDPHRVGLQSAVENLNFSSTDLVWGEAVATIADATIFYNIYASDDLFTLFDHLIAFSIDTSGSIPFTVVPDGYFFAVRASQKGVDRIFTDLESLEINDSLFAYPDPVSTTSILDTSTTITEIPVDGYVGFPGSDGYLIMGEEIFFYSSIDQSTSSFILASQDPFGCNDGYLYSSGTEVNLFKGFEDGNTTLFQRIETCILEPPAWYSGSLAGLEAAEDLGIGTVVNLRWGPAVAPPGVSLVYYNIYYSKVFEDLYIAAKGISFEQTVLVPDLDPGEIYYFAVRASYFPTNWDITELEQIGENFYAVPQTTVVADTDGFYFETDNDPLVVNTTEGFPEAGFLKLEAEVMQYDSKTSTSFNIIGRNVFGIGHSEDYENGTVVYLFGGIEEFNSTNFRAVPSWDSGVDTARMDLVDGYADYLQDDDGYRDFPDDNLTEDHSESESENDNRPDYPFCGYRATNFVDLYSGNFCGTYFGGRQGGFGGGINIGDINLQREELLLGLTGEPFILLRRKWTGKVCPEFTHRQEHPKARCPMCFGTGFLGGYDRYFHPRQIRPGVDNPNGFLQLRVDPYQDDLELNAERGLTQINQLNVWCTALPTIKDRDVLIKYNTDDQFNIIGEEFRYTVEFVNRNKILLNLDGRQQITMKRLDKTHTIYTYEVDLI